MLLQGVVSTTPHRIGYGSPSPHGSNEAAITSVHSPFQIAECPLPTPAPTLVTGATMFHHPSIESFVYTSCGAQDVPASLHVSFYDPAYAAFGVILATAASSIVVAIYVILRQSPSVFVSLASKGSQRPRAFIKGFHPHSRPAVAAFLRRFDTAKIALATSKAAATASFTEAATYLLPGTTARRPYCLP